MLHCAPDVKHYHFLFWNIKFYNLGLQITASAKTYLLRLGYFIYCANSTLM